MSYICIKNIYPKQQMQIRTWFGIFTLENDNIIDVELFPKDIDTITERLLKEPLLMRGSIVGIDIRDLAMNQGFVSSNEEYDRLLHETNIMLVKKQLISAKTRDMQIIASVEAIDDLDETLNILSERLKEWYMLNAGETALRGEGLARYVAGINEKGIELELLKNLASGLLALYKTRAAIESHLKNSMNELAPNLTLIAGHTLGARLLSITGSLERLAGMPSSTVQVLGASNALFKHLKGNATSPKHGVIFRHPLVNSAPKYQRGKIARAVASRISLAARLDYYSGKLKTGLQEELMKKVQAIRKRPGKSRKS
jgi:nucleolar protein 56